MNSNNKKIPRRRLGKASRTKLLQFMEEKNVTTFDAVLIGDGSGSKWTAGAGWGAVLVQYEPPDMFATAWYGAANRGTVNFAEAMAYLAPLTWLHAHEKEERGRLGGHRMLHVHIITDSQYCRTAGTSPSPSKYANGIIWSALANLKRMGVMLTWHWAPRNLAPYNPYCDDVSRRLNQLVAAYSVKEAASLTVRS